MKPSSPLVAQAGALSFALAVAVSALCPGAAHAEAPPLLPVQGYLTDADGVPVDGPHRLTFWLYDAESGGNVLFTDDYTSVDIAAGNFTVYLGSQSTALELALFAREPDVWLEILIDGDQTIQPRTRIGSVPYAGYANACGDALTLAGKADTAFAPVSHTHALTDLATGLQVGDEQELDAQILAQAICTTARGVGFSFAVRRTCSSGVSCDTICAGLTDTQAGTLSCFNAVHVYDDLPETANEALGLKTYLYGNCTATNCGPNFCCCGG